MAHEGESSVYADMYGKNPTRESGKVGDITGEVDIHVGSTSSSGDKLGYDSLARGAMHQSKSFVQPLILPEHHREHGHGAGHDESPIAYIYVSKQRRGASSNATSFPARVNRFVATLGEVTASRVTALEKLDRLVRVARSGIDLMSLSMCH